MAKDSKGITAEKDEFTEWFTQIMVKAELADYSKVSGCMVLRPASYVLWEKLVSVVDGEFKKAGIKNAYFPLFIPESLLTKEADHVEGFTPEVAWVTHAGERELDEKLAVRPTSEAIIYDSYSKWVRSYKDLPLRLNIWNNVVRWEFKHPVPFLRTREFLWQEGHNVYANSKDLLKDRDVILKIYDNFCRDYMALPSLIGRKSDKEKFAGAVNTYSLEFYMPNGKAIQGPDYHDDGQNFAKAYDIEFLDNNGKKQYPHQSTYAITTRMLGVMFAMHSDDKGLIIPPKMANEKIVIVPIFDNNSKQEVLEEAKEIADDLEKFGVILDDREDYRPGFKFNEYEMKGVPLRIELGKRDLESKSVVVARRDDGKKESVKISRLGEYVASTLDDIQKSLLKKAEKLLKEAVVSVGSFKELEEAIGNKKIGLTPLCSSNDCEEDVKHKTGGAKVLNIDEKKKASGKCVVCGKNSEYVARVGKSY